MAHLRVPSLGASASSTPILTEDASGVPVVVPDAPKPQPPIPVPVPMIPVPMPMPPQQAPIVAARTLLHTYPWILPAGGSLLGLLVGLTAGVAIGKRRRVTF